MMWSLFLLELRLVLEWKRKLIWWADKVATQIMGTWGYCYGKLLSDFKELVERWPLLTGEMTWKGWVGWGIHFLARMNIAPPTPTVLDTLVTPYLLVGEVSHQGNLFSREKHNVLNFPDSFIDGLTLTKYLAWKWYVISYRIFMEKTEQHGSAFAYQRESSKHSKTSPVQNWALLLSLSLCVA